MKKNAPHSSTTPTNADDWQLSIGDTSDLACLEREWRALEAHDATPFFLSWDWIGCWLRNLPAGLRPAVLRIQSGGQLAGLALLTPVSKRRLGIIPCHSLHLHETGNATLDALTIEYNGILSAHHHRKEATRRAIEWLLGEGHADALSLPGVSASILDSLDRRRFTAHIRDIKPVYPIDLAPTAADRREFLETISSNTRSQLRRAIRQYEGLGELRVIEAHSTDEAQDMLNEMIPLHQAYWQGRDRAGAFANSHFVEFHRRLIRDGYDKDCIQFFRCMAGPSVIGYLYNLKRDGRVYAYQSGFNYQLLPRSKPGWVCHYLAIEENRRQGTVVYDLLAGYSQFKASFAMPADELVWVTVERIGWHPTLMKVLRSGKKAFIAAMPKR
jgi:CelD/BcsL family acetyltransferase involved in cellulose biosynthesis